MPRYDYECPIHGKTERVVSAQDRDEDQRCECGVTMKRLPHYAAVQFCLPDSFTQASLSDYPTRPRDAETAKNWERDGVRPMSDKGKWV